MLLNDHAFVLTSGLITYKWACKDDSLYFACMYIPHSCTNVQEELSHYPIVGVGGGVSKMLKFYV